MEKILLELELFLTMDSLESILLGHNSATTSSSCQITKRYNIIRFHFNTYSTVPCSTAQCSTIHYSIVHYSTVQYSTVQYSTRIHGYEYELRAYLLVVTGPPEYHHVSLGRF